MKINSKTFIALGFLMIIGIFFAGKSFLARENQSKDASLDQGEKVMVYKSPNCGCCIGHIGFLRKDGYLVEVKETTNMDAVKKERNIPSSMQSCHTSIIGGYFVEGHMPLEVIDRLMDEKPDLDGIALPGMPAGSPGMPGLKTEEFIIYGLKDGEVSEYMYI